MRKLTPEFQSHLNGESLTLCNCWEIIRTDGIRMGFTDHDLDISFDELVFEASSGLEASQVESSIGLAPNNHEVSGALKSDSITDEDIASRVYDGARIKHFTVNWQQPDERVLMQTYLMGDITQQDGAFKVELKSLIALLDQTNTRKFEKRCSADLGDQKCGINLLTDHTHVGEIVSVINQETMLISGIEDKDGGWFAGGSLEFTSGANSGSRIEIAEHTQTENGTSNATLTLWSPMAKIVAVGDHIILHPGCDKLHSTCYAKFDNVLNFRGFPHLPNSDFIMSYAGNATDLDGGPLIP